MQNYAGSDWVKSAFAPETISPLGEAVADFLGDVFEGIYHLNSKALQKVDWSNDTWIDFVFRGSLATIDNDHLTRIVVLAHQRMLRVEIEGVGPGQWPIMRLR